LHYNTFALFNFKAMKEQDQLNYQRIAAAISYIIENFKKQPELDDIARKIHLSPFHFQRLFTQWAGVSPKKFIQYLSVEHAKKLLQNGQSTVFDAAFESGLSGTGRLHDLFVKIEGMTPGEYRNGGENLPINYSFAESPFGNLLVAATPKGICYMAFADDAATAMQELNNKFPNAQYTQVLDMIQQNALYIFLNGWSSISEIKLHLKGTAFQLKVWETLLKIPAGGLSTYSCIATHINNAGAARAVGSAIGSNPVAFLIPCHRVIQSSGIFGQYHWGSTRKAAIIGWESAKLDEAV
jgi:AraC family transcriptional regulator, regulatory protein of adaptative response / methylated-DNA-[protein]-cysteine methyltransferase